MKEKILVVEDNPMNMRLLEMMLEAKDYHVLKAADGEEAVAMTMSERPDLILMDMQLPKLSGIEVVRRLKLMPEFSNTPIIAITASAMRGDREKFIEAGCDAYLSKPVSTRVLPEVIKGILNRRGNYARKENTGDR